MMRLYGVLILLMIVSTACGLRCYMCTPADKFCTRTAKCPDTLNMCFSSNVTGLITKGCVKEAQCVGPTICCDHDLCNRAVSAGHYTVLLLVSTAITTIFL